MKRIIEQIIKFAFVGVVATLIDYGLMVILTEFAHINYLISSGISFSVSVIFNYIMSVRYVFNVTNNDSAIKQATVFILLSTIGLVFNQVLMFVFVDIFNVFYMIAKIFTTLIVMVYNFISRKLFLEK